MQTSLFNDSPRPDQFQEHILHCASIREYPAAFSSTVADVMFHTLLKNIPWRQDSIRIAGKTMPLPRLQCWMGDQASRYGYSSLRLQPVPWQEPVTAIRRRVERLAGMTFNSVLLNYYRNGDDSVAWHADDEAELGPDPIIASVSLGAVREFQLKPKFPSQTGSAIYRMPLLHGSVLLMGKGVQNNWLHRLPKVKNVQLSRLNLTFRHLV